MGSLVMPKEVYFTIRPWGQVHSRVPFSEMATSHIKSSPTQNLGSPVFDTYLELFKITMTLFRLNVPNLEILKIGDMPGMSPNFIMPFHSLDPTLVH